MPFKFENLEVWKLAVEYADIVSQVLSGLPKAEEYNLKTQWQRAATSVALNIAEGSTSQSNAEQARFLGYAIRSLIECVACLRLAERQRYLLRPELMVRLTIQSEILFAKLQAFKRSTTFDRE